MKWTRLFGLALAGAILISACSGGETVTEAPQEEMEPSPPLEPSAVPPSPTPAPTEEPTPEPTATPAGPLRFEFEIVSRLDNPILPIGEDSWDDVYTYAPYVIEHEGIFYMFYTGSEGTRSNFDSAIGLATSPDGIAFTRYEENPLLEIERGDPDESVVHAPVVGIRDDGTWFMVLAERGPGFSWTGNLRIATAPAPEGPWTLNSEPIFSVLFESWQQRMVPQSMVKADDGYYLLYDGGPFGQSEIGMIFSRDGINWEPYNDELTNIERYRDSDPVYSGQPGTWDGGGVGSPIIFATEDGFEMFYLGFENIEGRFNSFDRTLWLGYATSPDAIEWEPYEFNPVINQPDERGYPWMSGVKVGDTYYLYYAITAGADGVGLLRGQIVANN